MSGDGHLVRAHDLSDHDATPAVVREIADVLGPLDGLVHAAGMHLTAPLRVANARQTTELLDLNVTSALLLAKAFRHPKVRGPEASIVLLS